MSDSKTRPSGKISEQDVVDYLQKHQDFFVSNTDLLADIELPHASGKAISLVERQVSILRERNMDMRHRLSRLLDNARENDRLFDKTRRLVLALLDARELSAAIDALLFSFEKEFKIHFTNLLFFDISKDCVGNARAVSMQEARQSVGGLLKHNRVFCGRLEEEEAQFLFPKNYHELGSAAVVPLSYGSTYGLLAIGNKDAQYYRSSMGTLFLGYIVEVLNRLLPQLLAAARRR